MNKKTLLVTCSHCQGKGSVKISKECQEVYALFDHRNELTSLKILTRLGAEVTQSTINNRLEKLRGYGLLQREARGKWNFYFRPRAAKPDAQPQN